MPNRGSKVVPNGSTSLGLACLSESLQQAGHLGQLPAPDNMLSAVGLRESCRRQARGCWLERLQDALASRILLPPLCQALLCGGPIRAQNDHH